MMVMGQEQIQYLNGIVENDAKGFPMESVHVLNLNMVEGTTTDKKGILRFAPKSTIPFIFPIWVINHSKLLLPKT